jgi:hypothetical protein
MAAIRHRRHEAERTAREAAAYPSWATWDARTVRLRSKSVTTPFASVPPKAAHGSSTAVGNPLLWREELRSCANATHLQSISSQRLPSHKRACSGKPRWLEGS